MMVQQPVMASPVMVAAPAQPQVIVLGDQKTGATGPTMTTSANPIATKCYNCENQGLTNVQKNRQKQWMWCIILCVLGFVCFSFVPFCMDSCLSCSHSCSTCGTVVATKIAT